MRLFRCFSGVPNFHDFDDEDCPIYHDKIITKEDKLVRNDLKPIILPPLKIDKIDSYKILNLKCQSESYDEDYKTRVGGDSVSSCGSNNHPNLQRNGKDVLAWSHVDELAEEVAELKRRLQEEEDEASKLRDEVSLLRSFSSESFSPFHNALSPSPNEISEVNQESSSELNLLPSSFPNLDRENSPNVHSLPAEKLPVENLEINLSSEQSPIDLPVKPSQNDLPDENLQDDELFALAQNVLPVEIEMQSNLDDLPVQECVFKDVSVSSSSEGSLALWLSNHSQTHGTKSGTESLETVLKNQSSIQKYLSVHDTSFVLNQTIELNPTERAELDNTEIFTQNISQMKNFEPSFHAQNTVNSSISTPRQHSYLPDHRQSTDSFSSGPRIGSVVIGDDDDDYANMRQSIESDASYTQKNGGVDEGNDVKVNDDEFNDDKVKVIITSDTESLKSIQKVSDFTFTSECTNIPTERSTEGENKMKDGLSPLETVGENANQGMITSIDSETLDLLNEKLVSPPAPSLLSMSHVGSEQPISEACMIPLGSEIDTDWKKPSAETAESKQSMENDRSNTVKINKVKTENVTEKVGNEKSVVVLKEEMNQNDAIKSLKCIEENTIHSDVHSFNSPSRAFWGKPVAVLCDENDNLKWSSDSTQSSPSSSSSSVCLETEKDDVAATVVSPEAESHSLIHEQKNSSAKGLKVKTMLTVEAFYDMFEKDAECKNDCSVLESLDDSSNGSELIYDRKIRSDDQKSNVNYQSTSSSGSAEKKLATSPSKLESRLISKRGSPLTVDIPKKDANEMNKKEGDEFNLVKLGTFSPWPSSRTQPIVEVSNITITEKQMETDVGLDDSEADAQVRNRRMQEEINCEGKKNLGDDVEVAEENKANVQISDRLNIHCNVDLSEKMVNEACEIISANESKMVDDTNAVNPSSDEQKMENVFPSVPDNVKVAEKEKGGEACDVEYMVDTVMIKIKDEKDLVLENVVEASHECMDVEERVNGMTSTDAVKLNLTKIKVEENGMKEVAVNEIKEVKVVEVKDEKVKENVNEMIHPTKIDLHDESSNVIVKEEKEEEVASDMETKTKNEKESRVMNNGNDSPSMDLSFNLVRKMHVVDEKNGMKCAQSVNSTATNMNFVYSTAKANDRVDFISKKGKKSNSLLTDSFIESIANMEFGLRKNAFVKKDKDDIEKENETNPSELEKKKNLFASSDSSVIVHTISSPPHLHLHSQSASEPSAASAEESKSLLKSPENRSPASLKSLIYNGEKLTHGPIYGEKKKRYTMQTPFHRTSSSESKEENEGKDHLNTENSKPFTPSQKPKSVSFHVPANPTMSSLPSPLCTHPSLTSREVNQSVSVSPNTNLKINSNSSSNQSTPSKSIPNPPNVSSLTINSTVNIPVNRMIFPAQSPPSNAWKSTETSKNKVSSLTVNSTANSPVNRMASPIKSPPSNSNSNLSPINVSPLTINSIANIPVNRMVSPTKSPPSNAWKSTETSPVKRFMIAELQRGNRERQRKENIMGFSKDWWNNERPMIGTDGLQWTENGNLMRASNFSSNYAHNGQSTFGHKFSEEQTVLRKQSPNEKESFKYLNVLQNKQEKNTADSINATPSKTASFTPSPPPLKSRAEVNSFASKNPRKIMFKK